MLGLGCALVALVAGTMMAPAMASAQADQEYNLQISGRRRWQETRAAGPPQPPPDTDGGGGAPIVLIGLAAVAAGCAGVAAWRLRNRDQSDDPKVDQTRGPQVGPGTGAAGATSKSQ